MKSAKSKPGATTQLTRTSASPAGQADSQPPPRTTCSGHWPPARSSPRVTTAGSARGASGPPEQGERATGVPEPRLVGTHRVPARLGAGRQQEVDGGGGSPAPGVTGGVQVARPATSRGTSRPRGGGSGRGFPRWAARVEGDVPPPPSRRAYRTSVTALISSGPYTCGNSVPGAAPAATGSAGSRRTGAASRDSSSAKATGGYGEP